MTAASIQSRRMLACFFVIAIALLAMPVTTAQAQISRASWRVLYVDSQATDCGNQGATNAIDGNPATAWFTEWCNSAPPTPHEIQIDLGANYNISGFQYLPRQDQYSNGNIATYEFYVSTDGVNWGTAVSTGTLMASASDKTQKQVTFTGTAGRYVRLRALTEVSGGPWTNAAEINVLGSAVATSGPQVGSLTLNPASIAGGGNTSTATVTLTSAPSSSATVTLASSNTAAATVPATVTVNAGATSANFAVTSASSVSATALSVINATYNGSTGAALLTVTAGASSVGTLPRNGWRVLYVDSQAIDCGNGAATNAIDGNPATVWFTEWCNSAPPTPHEIQIDLGANYTISGFQYLPRQDQYFNGNIRAYEFYVSTDGVNWGTAVASGTLMTSTSDKSQKQVIFTSTVGRYVRLRALSEVNGGPWTDVAELNVLGTLALSTIPTAGWRLLYVDSQETGCANQPATNAFDGNPATMWVTQWCTSAPPTPHEIQIDLGATYTITGFQYLPRQDQYSNGDIANYEFYVSADGVNWGTAASSGTLITNPSDHSQKLVTFAGTAGRYVRLRALTEVNGGPWTAVAELNVLGSAVATSGAQVASVMLTPASIAAGGNTSTASVTLTSAPLTNVSMTLTSSNPGAATVPATVTVSAGTTTASFSVTSASTVSTTVTSVIGAALNGSNGTATLTVTPASLASIPQSGWRVLYVDSQETACANEGAANAIDGNPATMWVTQWCHSPIPATPHEIQIDLGASYTITGFQYLPRQDQYSNGDIANYEFYVSTDGVNWGTAVASGTLITSASDHTQKQVTFTATAGRYVRLRALTEVNGGPWTAVAELNVLGTPIWSGLLAPSRAINWSSAGVIGGIPNRTTICATINPYNGPADTINAAIANCPSGQVVFLNAGTYNLSSGIVFGNQSGVTLRGAGPDQTFLVFSAGGLCNGLGANICVQNSDNNSSSAPHNVATWTGTTEGGAGSYPVGATHMTLGSVTTGSISNLHVGSLLVLDQNSDYPNDPGTIYVCDSTGCSQQGGIGCGRAGTNGSPGNRVQNQQVTVTSISGTGPWTIGITPGLYAPNWRSAMSPGAWWSNAPPVTGVGIENLSVDHSAVTNQDGAGIEFANAANSWVENVRSINAGSIPQHKHVWVYQSSHITVRDSYFYGSSPTSEGYGVDMGCSSSDNLAENNIFQHVAVGTICEDSVGSVFGYNYAIDNYYNNGDPAWQQQDAYHHSAGDNFILWEGQIGSGLALDDIHGSSFMLTTFRNRWSGRDPSLSSGSAKTESTIGAQIFAYNRYANLVGNVFGTAGYHTNYQAVASSGSDSGSAVLGNASIYTIGYSGSEGTNFTGVPNDTLTASTLLRWGNYDTVNNAVRFVSSEVPSGLAAYANPVPATQALPASFYLAAKPSWFGSVPWPPIGPDVTGGDVPNIGGHAYKIPAQRCYESSAQDANGILINFNAVRCY